MRSGRTSRASTAPRIDRRGWASPPVRTVSPADSRRSRSSKPRALTGGRASPSAITAESRAPVVSPPFPDHSSAPATASIASTSRRAATAGLTSASNRARSGAKAASRRRTRSMAASASSPALSVSRASISARRRGRGPRRAWRSITTARAAMSSAARPRRTARCFSTASHTIGSNGLRASPARCCASSIGPLAARAVPAAPSGSRPQRVRRAEMRRARSGSGVIRAQVLPGVSSVSRISKAQTAAASSSCRAPITDRPLSPTTMGSTPPCSSRAASARRDSIWASQSAVASAGRIASPMIRRRQRPAMSPAATTPGRQGETSPRVIRAFSSRRFRALCGCWSSILAQAASANPSSRPGSTTAPFGMSAITVSRAAVAGAVPVEPAAITAPCGGFSRHCSARPRSRATRRTETSTRPSVSSRAVQAARSASARATIRPAASTSSMARLSNRPPTAWAMSRAAGPPSS